jgi:glutamate carboxypeptidase
MHVDLRAAFEEDLPRLEADVRAILCETGDPRVTVAVEGGWSRPLFPENSAQALYVLAEGFAKEIGVPVVPVISSGGSDGSFAAALGRPTLDGLGPVCFDTCSRREKIVIASLAERGAILGAVVNAVAERK